MAKKVQLPQNPDNRKFIIIADDVNINEARFSRQKWFFQQGINLCVINWDDLWSEAVEYTDPLFKSLMKQGLISPAKQEEGNYIRILVQNPYDKNKYHVLNNKWDVMYDVAADKFLIFEKLLEILGTKNAFAYKSNDFIYDFLDVPKMVMESVNFSFVNQGNGIYNQETLQNFLRRYNLHDSNEMQGIVFASKNKKTNREFYPYKEITATLRLGLKLNMPILSGRPRVTSVLGGSIFSIFSNRKLNYAENNKILWHIEFY